jgi:hypothetical protein
MTNIKHIGRIKNNKRRAIVAYRTLPGDPYSALIVMTESLPADEHDALIKLVESPAGQQAYELAEAMARTYLPDGRNMLTGFHATGQLKKIPTTEIEMTPNSQTSIMLDQLNQVIAKQQGVALEDLALKDPSAAKKAAQKQAAAQDNPYLVAEQITDAVTAEPPKPEDLASQMRSQADAMFKEAKRLREVAETIVPTKKKAKVESAE